jgi:hypothetical protein
MADIEGSPSPEKRTIGSILWNHYLDKIERDPGKHFFRPLIRLFIVIVLFISTIFLDFAIMFWTWVFSVFAILVFFYWLFVVFKWDFIVQCFVNVFSPVAVNEELFADIFPPDELVTYLWNHKVFSWNNVQADFKFMKMTKYKWDKVAKILFKNGILIKDVFESNTYKLNPKKTRQEIAYLIGNYHQAMLETAKKRWYARIPFLGYFISSFYSKSESRNVYILGDQKPAVEKQIREEIGDDYTELFKVRKIR